MKNCWFITGTDTNVGKTVSSVLLLKLAREYGYKTAGYKPIASGNNNIIKMRNNDAMLLQKFSTEKLSYEEVNPYFFDEPVCPYFISLKKKLIFALINYH